MNTKKLLVTPFKSDQDHSWLANRHHLLSKKTSSPKSQCSEFIPKYPKNTLFSANFNSAVLHSVKFIQTALFKFYYRYMQGRRTYGCSGRNCTHSFPAPPRNYTYKCIPLFLPCPEVVLILAPMLFSSVWRQ